MQWMLGAPSEVVAMMGNVAHDNAEVEDLSAAIFRFPNGTLAQLTASVVHHGEDQKIILQGEKARLSAPWKTVANQAAENGFPEKDNNIALESELERLYADVPPLNWTLHAGQVNDFFCAIEQQCAPLIDGEQGKRSLELITAIYKSAITKSTVSLPIPEDDAFYCTGGLIASAPHFYEKQASVDNFADVDDIPLGKNFA